LQKLQILLLFYKIAGIIITNWYNYQYITIKYFWDRCPTGLNREVRCNAGAVPPL